MGVAANTRFNNLREMEGPAIFTPLRDAAGRYVEYPDCLAAGDADSLAAQGDRNAPPRHCG